ncbi:MAG: calcium/sodium antiporter [Bacteroidaceae bacterium]|nr:calcium/sodium antiporter [Bacteroidaceae bacterium]
MLLEFVWIVVCMAVVLWGADRFTDGSCALARRLKVSELVIGLTVVALGTSLPEFIVSFMSVLRGSGDMSVGNIVGSNVFNTLVVIGASSIMLGMKVESSLLKRDLPLMFTASVMLIAFAGVNRVISLWEGLAFLGFFFIYTLIAYRIGLRDRKAAQEVAPTEQMPLWKIFLFIFIGIAALAVGGRFLVDNAAAVARKFEISESVIGITILAAGTSLPELMTSIVAARKGSEGLALGNAIGSNIFNIAFVLGICSTVSPIVVTELTLTDWVMLVGSCLLVWLLALTGRKLSRKEGVVLVLCYLVYLVLLLKG